MSPNFNTCLWAAGKWQEEPREVGQGHRQAGHRVPPSCASLLGDPARGTLPIPPVLKNPSRGGLAARGARGRGAIELRGGFEALQFPGAPPGAQRRPLRRRGAGPSDLVSPAGSTPRRYQNCTVSVTHPLHPDPPSGPPGQPASNLKCAPGSCLLKFAAPSSSPLPTCQNPSRASPGGSPVALSYPRAAGPRAGLLFVCTDWIPALPLRAHPPQVTDHSAFISFPSRRSAQWGLHTVAAEEGGQLARPSAHSLWRASKPSRASA